MDVAPVLSNPTLYYRPDPGEPAFRTSARASESALVVMTQERRNLNRILHPPPVHTPRSTLHS